MSISAILVCVRIYDDLLCYPIGSVVVEYDTNIIDDEIMQNIQQSVLDWAELHGKTFDDLAYTLEFFY